MQLSITVGKARLSDGTREPVDPPKHSKQTFNRHATPIAIHRNKLVAMRRFGMPPSSEWAISIPRRGGPLRAALEEIAQQPVGILGLELIAATLGLVAGLVQQ